MKWMGAVSLALALVSLGVGSSANAQTIGSTNANNSRLITDEWSIVGQSIDPPNGVNLASFTFRLSATPAWRFVPEVYEIPVDNALTAPVWVGDEVALTSARDFVATPNIALDGSKTYAIVLRKVSAGDADGIAFGDDQYPDGSFVLVQNSAWTTATRSDMYFSATFSPTPVAVPTLSQWGQIGLLAALALGGGWAVRSRVRARA